MSKARRAWRPRASVCAPLLKALQQWVYRMKIGSHGSFPSMMPCTHTFKASKSEPAPKPGSGFSQRCGIFAFAGGGPTRSEEHTSELQSLRHLVCRLLLEK